jgi:hypothetical protein
MVKKQLPKTITLVFSTQRRAPGAKFKTLKETRIQYTTIAGMMKGIKTRYSDYKWETAENETSYVWAPTLMEGNYVKERVFMYAYQDIPGSWMKQQLSLNYLIKKDAA